MNTISDSLELNSFTLSGCMDIIVVKQIDGELKSSAFHVRFGTSKIFKSKLKLVKIIVNGEEIIDKDI